MMCDYAKVPSGIRLLQVLEVIEATNNLRHTILGRITSSIRAEGTLVWLMGKEAPIHTTNNFLPLAKDRSPQRLSQEIRAQEAI